MKFNLSNYSVEAAKETELDDELKKNEELILFCRYLVEDNHDSFLIVDMQRRQDI